MCLYFFDNLIFGLFVGVGWKVKIFICIRFDLVFRGSDFWKWKINKENNMKCLVLFGYVIGVFFDNVKFFSYIEMLNFLYFFLVLI